MRVDYNSLFNQIYFFVFLQPIQIFPKHKIITMRVVFTKIKFFSTLLLLMFFSLSAWSQSEGALDIALRHLNENKASWNLTDEDISDLVVSDQYVSKISGATMLYLTQYHQGVKVQNAIFNVAISEDGKVVYAGNRIISDISSKVNTVDPTLTPDQAIQSALQHLEVEFDDSLVQKERKNSHEFVFEKGAYSKSDIPVRLHLYQYQKAVRLVWETQIEMVDENNYWSLQVDATNGKVLFKSNLLIKCDFGAVPYHNHDASCRSLDNVRIVGSQKETTTSAAPTVLLGGSYNVYAEKDADGNLHPHESPNHGDRNMLTNVEHATASPFGWHDTNGQVGTEFTITRGNNAHAYLDIAGNNTPQGDEPEGGANLEFDFPIDANDEPETFAEAAVTNAFFMVNFLHDFTYLNGFDEAAGNFQANNYGNGGAGNDWVHVEIHDGSGTNNANFATPGDGGNGRMQMFLWNAGTEGLITVNEPSDVAGVYESSHPDWGAAITTTPLSGEVAVVDDGTATPSFSCEELVNPTEVHGKIALIDRGGCEFGLKVINAENAGAIGAIICNFEDNLIGMAPGAVGDNATIPVVMMTAPDCALIRGFAGNGLNLSFVVPPGNAGPTNVSGGIDNGVIAHEFGHGVSNRLVGGPNAAGCLGNQEQMGEGISDFFTLVTTVKPGDTGDMKKGIGTYVNREATDGRGIRRYPYSTDMTINPLTYKDIVGEAQHARGAIWSAALWDMYWLFVDQYGFDPDYFEGTGGNNIAVKLVIEGMKLNPCSPGYMDGRDAILAADELMYGGVNQCLIWEAFARRGMGDLANQVDNDDTSDGFEDFSVPGLCTKDVRLAKTFSEIVVAGEMIDVKLEATNFKDDAVTNVVITDEIPDGTTVVAGSGGMVSGNTISFTIASMASMEEVELTYQLETDPNNFSVTSYVNDMEADDVDTEFDIEITTGNNIWEVTETDKVNSGVKSWLVPNVAGENEQAMFQVNPILVEGTQPVLRFYHWYETQTAVDGGIVEISRNGGSSWEQIGDKMFRNGYQRVLSYQTFVIPFLSAFSGKSNLDGSNDLTATYVDLSDYLGETIQVRFRFGANTLDAATWGAVQDNFDGWYVDDVEYMDMRNYVGEACLTTDEGDNACDSGIARGTIVESQIGTVSTNDPFDNNMEITVYPNPADEMINLRVLNDKSANATVRLLSVDGKEVLNQSFRTSNGMEIMNLNVSNIPAGMYFVKVSTSDSIVVEKVTIK